MHRSSTYLRDVGVSCADAHHAKGDRGDAQSFHIAVGVCEHGHQEYYDDLHTDTPQEETPYRIL